MRHFTTMADGTDIYLDEPDFTNVSIDTFATHLAKLCRFNGACKGWYSVAKHSVIGAMALRRKHGEATARAYLMHDAHEAVIGDMTSPVKRHLRSPQWNHLADTIDFALFDRFDIDANGDVNWFAVDQMDHEMLYYEWINHMPGTPESVGIDQPLDSILSATERHSVGHVSLHWVNDENRFIECAEFLGMV